MIQATTLVELLNANRSVERHITYIEGEGVERRIPYGELHRRALGILWHLQRLGASRGDRMILFLNNNEAFIDGFWGALAGGIVPVPLAVGISDEHRWKLLRIAKKLGSPFLYTDRKTLDRLGSFAEGVGERAAFEALRSRAFLIESLEDVDRPGKQVDVAPGDVAFIQFSSGSTSEPKGIVLTHANLLATIRAGRPGAQAA